MRAVLAALLLAACTSAEPAPAAAPAADPVGAAAAADPVGAAAAARDPVGAAAPARDPVGAAAPAPDPVGAAAPVAIAVPLAPPRPAQLTRVTVKALGMYCEESCPLAVRTALAAVPAVYELGFDLANESVFLSYDATLGPPTIVTAPVLAAIRSVGFDPWLARESWPPDAVVQVVRR